MDFKRTLPFLEIEELLSLRTGYVPSATNQKYIKRLRTMERDLELLGIGKGMEKSMNGPGMWPETEKKI